MSCPFDSINVTKQPNTLKVDAVKSGSTTPEPSKYFTGPNRFAEFKQFWDLLTTTSPSMSNCVNPLTNDPEYQSATGSLSPADSTHLSNMWSGMPNPNVQSGIGTWSGSLLPDNNPLTSLDLSLSTTGMSGMSDSSDSYFSGLESDASKDLKSFDNKYLYIVLYIVKIGVLFAFVFVLLTYIPTVQIRLINKLLICTAVVFLHSIIDILAFIFQYLRRSMCSTACGC